MKTVEEKNHYQSLDIESLIKELAQLDDKLHKSLNYSPKNVIKKSATQKLKKNKARILTVINEKRKQKN